MEQPLAGWRVVLTRAADRSDGLAQRLRTLGAEPLFFPTIAFAPPDDMSALDDALQQLTHGAFDWLILTSATAARAAADRLAQLALAQALPVSLRVAAVGPATAAACVEHLGLTPAVVPATFVATALAEALGDLRGQRMLLLNADLARPTLEAHLRMSAADVQRVVAYRTVAATGGTDLAPLLHAGGVAAILFASGSAVRFFAQRLGPKALFDARRTVIVSIGPVTSEEAHAVGLPPRVTATQATEAGMIDALVAYANRLRDA